MMQNTGTSNILRVKIGGQAEFWIEPEGIINTSALV